MREDASFLLGLASCFPLRLQRALLRVSPDCGISAVMRAQLPDSALRTIVGDDGHRVVVNASRSTFCVGLRGWQARDAGVREWTGKCATA